jgi:hypothetical protein
MTLTFCLCRAQALPLVDAPGVAPVALGLLYHLSVDDKARHMFVFGGAAAPLADMLMRSQVSWLLCGGALPYGQALARHCAGGPGCCARHCTACCMLAG